MKRSIKNSLIQIFVFGFVLHGNFGPLFANEPVAIDQQASFSGVFLQARQILSNLKSTHYSHKTKIDVQAGVYVLDCSALVCYILSKAAPASLASVPVDPDHRRARAKNYYDTFTGASLGQTQNGWQRIPRLADAEPGDFIVWRKNPMPKRGNTGHIVVVMEKPVLENNSDLRVVVLDASRSGHAFDTRKKTDNGVGMGTMWFKVDETGAPIAIHWSSPKRKPVFYPLAIGRAVAMPAP